MYRPPGILIVFFKRQVFGEGGGACVCVCVCVCARAGIPHGDVREVAWNEGENPGTLKLGDGSAVPGPPGNSTVTFGKSRGFLEPFPLTFRIGILPSPDGVSVRIRQSLCVRVLGQQSSPAHT